MESVWDYPRPPRLEPTNRHIVVRHRGHTIADSRRAMRVLETSHPPTYYIPREDVDMSFIEEATGTSFCEWKGTARYWTVVADGDRIERTAWSYPDPTSAFRPMKDHLCFYAHGVDECRVDDERVQPQPGSFYGGWITSDIKGPFKGGPGTVGW